SRRTGRWVIPKGWPMPDQRPYGAALTEADEEAGVEGKVDSTCIGVFRYIKHADRPDALPCAVAVYPVQVNRLKKTWREKAERKRKWFSQKRAAAEVGEADLAQIIREFDPKRRS
ncbi:MAG: NUDIX hydrolase, partial [Pseudomonadota bacterium]